MSHTRMALQFLQHMNTHMRSVITKPLCSHTWYNFTMNLVIQECPSQVLSIQLARAAVHSYKSYSLPFQPLTYFTFEHLKYWISMYRLWCCYWILDIHVQANTENSTKWYLTSEFWYENPLPTFRYLENVLK